MDKEHTSRAQFHEGEKRDTLALPNPNIYVDMLGKKAIPMPADCIVHSDGNSGGDG